MYIIPANSKKSMLILGFFTELDLIVFGIGVGLTILLLITIASTKVSVMILILLPALISALMVAPVPYYHNVMQLIRNVIGFFSNRRNYIWKGWCWHDVESITK